MRSSVPSHLISSHLIWSHLFSSHLAFVSSYLLFLFTEANICLAVSKGYISGLLDIYEIWHSKDTPHAAIGICHALLRCFHNVSRITAGSQALVSLGGLRLLYQTSQVTTTSGGTANATVDVELERGLISRLASMRHHHIWRSRPLLTPWLGNIQPSMEKPAYLLDRACHGEVTLGCLK